MLCDMVKICLHLKIIMFFRTFGNFAFLVYWYKQNEKPSFMYLKNILLFIENKLIFFQTLYWQKREFPPVGFKPDASRLLDECPNR